MIVVSNTTPLNYLVLIDAIHVLPDLFREVLVPPVVIAELQHTDTPPEVQAWVQSKPPWLRQQAPKYVDPAIKLHAGEAHAIALAEEVEADRILIDERKGRSVAQARGLRVIGTLAVLDTAAARQLIDLGETLRKLRKTSFRLSNELEAELLAREKSRVVEHKPRQPRVQD